MVKLKLDDIDWNAGEVCIQGKGARIDRLPLLQDVGLLSHIADLSKEDPPALFIKNVFLSTPKHLMRGLPRRPTASPASFAAH